MSIEEFIDKFIEREESPLVQVVFAFLGYATLAIAGLVYIYKEYINQNANARNNVPDTTWLLMGSFILAAIACFLLISKLDGRKNFCIVWLPAKQAELSKNNCSVLDKQLISDFCNEYHCLDMGKGFPEHIKAYLNYSKLKLWCLKITHKEYIKIVIFFLIFLSVDFYTTAIRRECLRLDAMWSLQALFHWLCNVMNLLGNLLGEFIREFIEFIRESHLFF